MLLSLHVFASFAAPIYSQSMFDCVYSRYFPTHNTESENTKTLAPSSFTRDCVGQAIVQGDEGPVNEVAQGVQVHGVVVRHGEKQEKEECEVEQEEEGDGEKTLKDEDTCAWMGWK